MEYVGGFSDNYFGLYILYYAVCVYLSYTLFYWGTLWRSWLRYCATNWRVAGSITDGAIGFFHWHNPSGRPMALGLTQPLTEMSTRNVSWGKGGRCLGLTTLTSSYAIILKSGILSLLEPSGSVQACNAIALPLHCFTSFTYKTWSEILKLCYVNTLPKYLQSQTQTTKKHYLIRD